MNRCQAAPDKYGPVALATDLGVQVPANMKILAGLYSDLRETITALFPRAQLNPSDVYVVGYPDPLHNETGALCPIFIGTKDAGGFENLDKEDEVTWAENAFMTPLERATSDFAAGWNYVGLGSLFDKHGYCSTDTWFNQIQDFTEKKTTNPSGILHPTATGQGAIVDELSHDEVEALLERNVGAKAVLSEALQRLQSALGAAKTAIPAEKPTLPKSRSLPIRRGGGDAVRPGVGRLTTPTARPLNMRRSPPASDLERRGRINELLRASEKLIALVSLALERHADLASQLVLVRVARMPAATTSPLSRSTFTPTSAVYSTSPSMSEVSPKPVPGSSDSLAVKDFNPRVSPGFKPVCPSAPPSPSSCALLSRRCSTDRPGQQKPRLSGDFRSPLTDSNR